MKKRISKRGSAEVVSIILGIVVIGGLALAVGSTVSKQSKSNIETGIAAQTTQMTTNYNDAVQDKAAPAPALSQSK